MAAALGEAAVLLAQAYGRDAEIWLDDDRESGGARLCILKGECGSAHVGIKAWLVTARARDEWEQRARVFESEAETGRASWQAEPLHDRQRRHARERAAADRMFLAEHPEGQFTVFAHVDGAAVLAAGGPREELARQPWWYAMPSGPGYYHGPAGSVREALSWCLRFVPARPALPGVPENEAGTW